MRQQMIQKPFALQGPNHFKLTFISSLKQPRYLPNFPFPESAPLRNVSQRDERGTQFNAPCRRMRNVERNCLLLVQTDDRRISFYRRNGRHKVVDGSLPHPVVDLGLGVHHEGNPVFGQGQSSLFILVLFVCYFKINILFFLFKRIHALCVLFFPARWRFSLDNFKEYSTISACKNMVYIALHY